MLNVPIREKEKAAVNAPQSKRFANSAAGESAFAWPAVVKKSDRDLPTHYKRRGTKKEL